MTGGLLRHGRLLTAWECPWCLQLHRLDVGPGVDLSQPRVVVCVRCEKPVRVMPP